jgi:uncharacterized tellurite resistance protein B-like protein
MIATMKRRAFITLLGAAAHGRRRIVEMMWEIIYADGPVTEFESNLMWRAADLLGISSRERIELGQRVASRRGTDPV